MTSSHGRRTRSRSRCRSDANTPLARGRPKNETLRVRVVGIGDDHIERRWRDDPGRSVAGSREDRGVRGSARWHEPIDPQRRGGGRRERPVVAASGASTAVVALPSLKCHSPMRPACGAISVFLAAWISDRLRATFQIRTSSTTPWKKPAATPVEVIAVPTAGVLDAGRLGHERARQRSVWSRAPSR